MLQMKILKSKLSPEIKGDKVLASAHSRFLLKDGWKGSRKNIPASYLTGYMAGKKALSNGVTDAILYGGTRRYTDRMAAALKGVIDAGVKVPVMKNHFHLMKELTVNILKLKMIFQVLNQKLIVRSKHNE